MHHHGSWSLPVTLALAIAALLDLRAGFNHPRRLAAFESGLLVLWIAVGSSLAHRDHAELTAHMAQHLLIMTVAAPLLLWGTRKATRLKIRVHPVVCWLAGTGVVTWWHVPAIFNLGMSSAVWHGVEQGTFLTAGLLFWLPVVQHWSDEDNQWSVPLYLFLATLPCDALSAFLTFCGHVVYPSYLSEPGLTQSSVLVDQACAGALMWVWVTFAYLFPAVAITIRILSTRGPTSALGTSEMKTA
jgi:cytochrome c oxidase assembly factor CtaG